MAGSSKRDSCSPPGAADDGTRQWLITITCEAKPVRPHPEGRRLRRVWRRMWLSAGPHGSPGDAKHRPETARTRGLLVGAETRGGAVPKMASDRKPSPTVGVAADGTVDLKSDRQAARRHAGEQRQAGETGVAAGSSADHGVEGRHRRAAIDRHLARSLFHVDHRCRRDDWWNRTSACCRGNTPGRSCSAGRCTAMTSG